MDVIQQGIIRGFPAKMEVIAEIDAVIRDYIQRVRPFLLQRLMNCPDNNLVALEIRSAGYQADPERIYGFPCAGVEVKFRVTEDRRAIVISIE